MGMSLAVSSKKTEKLQKYWTFFSRTFKADFRYLMLPADKGSALQNRLSKKRLLAFLEINADLSDINGQAIIPTMTFE